jgi:hypothetical protein
MSDWFILGNTLEHEQACSSPPSSMAAYFESPNTTNAHFGSFPVKNYSKEPFGGWLRVNFCRRAAGTPNGR